jgi:hypothetical protein
MKRLKKEGMKRKIRDTIHLLLVLPKSKLFTDRQSLVPVGNGRLETDRQSPVTVGNVGGGDVQGGGGVLPRTAAGTGGGGAVGQAGEHAGLTALVPLLRQTLKDKNSLVRHVRA